MTQDRLTSDPAGMARQSDGRLKVGIVGTGMAGLVTAYLLNTRCDLYDVHVFESGSAPSLDAASVDVDDAEGRTWHIDVPMRAFTDGYCHNLKRMYDFLDIRYRKQSLRYVFSKQPTSDDDCPNQPYFIHTSNRHEVSSTGLGAMHIGTYMIELCFVVIWYTWFTICCLLIAPRRSRTTGLSETFGGYLQRTMLPHRFVALYLLPLFSVVATCSHEEFLQFPASDVVNYRRSILFKDHYVVTDGINKAQSELTAGVNITTGVRVEEMHLTSSGFRLKVSTGYGDSREMSEHSFDRIIMAIPPNEAASIWRRVKMLLGSFPTRSVTTIAHNRVVKSAMSEAEVSRADDVHLCTSSEFGGWTEARHEHHCGISITSNISETAVIPSDTLSESIFTRVLRTPESKRIVDRIFEPRQDAWGADQLQASWRNGDDGVWLAGAWCWDGMVLLEGAVTSAMRVARDFGVEVPWQ